MEIERLKKDSRKKWLIGVGVIVIIVATIMFVGARAKYKNTERIDLVDGAINWIPNDLNVIAVKLQNDLGEYESSDTVPTSGYTLSDKSYCEVNGTKDSTISMEYKDGKVIIGVTTKGTKCYLYFDKELNAGETILVGKTIDTSRANGLTGIFTTNTTGKIFKAEDNDGDTYFFAGAVDNNWVNFGGFYWRIIRINGDKTIRMIYNGTSTTEVGEGTQIKTSTSKTTVQFNTNYGDNAYVGYMYGTISSSTYANTHANIYNSTVKTQLDTWYNTNLNKDGVKEYIDTNAGFCGDRKVYMSSSFSGYGTTGYGSNATTYEPTSRFMSWSSGNGSWKITIDPTFKCSQNNDLYTVSGASKGNKALTYPVGLITVDEAGYAGGIGETENTDYYLYTNSAYWTMSPYNCPNASEFIVNSNGALINYYVLNTYGMRPVINLRADTKLTGTGTTTDPYKVA